MTDITTRLEELVQKASKLSDAQSKETTSLLLKLYSEAGDRVATATYLMKFKSTVCQYFFERATTTIQTEKIESLHNAIRITELYKKNLNHAATIRGFIISAVLIKYEQKIGRAVLVQTLSDVGKDGKFSDTVIEHFKKTVLEYCGLDTISKLNEREWRNAESKDRFIRFMRMVSDSIATIASTATNTDKSVVESVINAPTATTTSQKYTTTHSVAKTVPLVAEPVPTPLKADDSAVTQTTELLKLLERSHCEAQKLFQTLNQSNGAIMTLREQVGDRDNCIAKLDAEIQERDKQIADLHSVAAKARDMNDELQSKISDLTERLKLSMQMDTISQNQELITLKSDLLNSLKLEYDDYLHDKDIECNSDTFGAFRSSLTRIFKTLRRFGIVFD